jgi:GR25 family glycosyltransferase involved in LPS biosynthesis
VSISPARLETDPGTQSVLSDPWQSFERIYCISLAQRPDRCRSARAQFQRIGLADRVEFVIVDKHPTDSERGIFESHLACLRAGLAAGAKKIVIFEDDILIWRFSPQRLRHAAHFMDCNTDWRLFFFGCFVNSSRKTTFPSVVKVSYRCTAHGYVVNREFAEKLVDIPWQGIPYDDLLRATADGGVYAIYPAFAFQNASSTDNDNLRRVDRVRRILGGFRLLQQFNEFSSRRIVPIIAAHVVLVLLLLLILLLRYGIPWR